MRSDFITSPDEKVIWRGKPVLRPYIILGLKAFMSSVRFLIFSYVLIIVISKIGKNGLNWGMMLIWGLLVMSFELFKFTKRYIAYKNIQYFITNWRIIIVTKSSGCPVKSIDRSWIKALDISISKVERTYSAGTVIIDIGEVRDNDGGKEKVLYKLEAISSPENVLRLL